MIPTKALVKLAIFLCTSTAWAAQESTFGKACNVKGDLAHFQTSYEDGMKLDLYSSTARTITVNKKSPPSLPASFVSQSGEFIALNDYSYTISTSDKARDLIGAQISVPFKSDKVGECQAFLGKLSHDGKSWMIFDGKAIHDSTGKTTGVVTQGHLDGEWMLLGRKSPSKFYSFGDDAKSAFNLVGGEGRQKAQWIDGLKMSVTSSEKKAVNVNIGPASKVSGLPEGYEVFSNHVYNVKSSGGSGTVKAHMNIPFNRKALKTKLKIEKGEGRGKCVKVAVGCTGKDGKVTIKGHEMPMPLGMPRFMGPPPPGMTGLPPLPTGTDAAPPPPEGYPTGEPGAQGSGAEAEVRRGYRHRGAGHHGHHGGPGGHRGGMGRHHKMGLPAWGITELDGTYFLMTNPSSVGDCMEMFKEMFKNRPHGGPWGPPGAGASGSEDGPEDMPEDGPDGEDGGDDEGAFPGGEEGGEGEPYPPAEGTDVPAQEPTATQQAPPAETGYPTEEGTQAPAQGTQEPAQGTQQAAPTGQGYPSRRLAKRFNRHMARRAYNEAA